MSHLFYSCSPSLFVCQATWAQRHMAFRFDSLSTCALFLSLQQASLERSGPCLRLQRSDRGHCLLRPGRFLLKAVQKGLFERMWKSPVRLQELDKALGWKSSWPFGWLACWSCGMTRIGRGAWRTWPPPWRCHVVPCEPLALLRAIEARIEGQGRGLLTPYPTLHGYYRYLHIHIWCILCVSMYTYIYIHIMYIYQFHLTISTSLTSQTPPSGPDSKETRFSSFFVTLRAEGSRCGSSKTFGTEFFNGLNGLLSRGFGTSAAKSGSS